MVIAWIEGYFDQLNAAGYQSNELAQTGIMVNLFGARYCIQPECIFVIIIYCAFCIILFSLVCVEQLH